MDVMRVGVLDVGSNTIRLLVAAPAGRGVEAVREERAVLGLGEEIEQHGRIGDVRLARTAERAREYARLARKAGVSRLDVIVTAPGRQAENAHDLVAALERACRHDVRVLSPDEEGRLAFLGAVAQARRLPDRVAVCDVGGGSTEIVVGTPGGHVGWSCSVEIGSLRLTGRAGIDDPPTKRSLAAAREIAEQELAEVEPPPVDAALATGGSARALRRLVGRTLAEDDIAEAIRMLRKRPAAATARVFELDVSRARTLPAGATILLVAARTLGVPFEVARGGLREGAALELLADLLAA